MTTELKPHPLADILRAIADGVPVQWLTGVGWSDWIPSDHIPIMLFEWRIKPKPKVKVWQWVFKSNLTGELAITMGHFKDQNDCEHHLAKYSEAIQKIDATMKEIEE